MIYDNGSVPGGPFACEPTGGDLEGMMLVGNPNVEPEDLDFTWTVDEFGHGTINATNLLDEGQFGDPEDPPPGPFTTSTYVSLDDFDTISIRQLELGFAVVACGEVATHPAN